MAYRYPPPLMASPNEQKAPFTPLVNFNIPPPGFESSCNNKAPKDDFHFEYYQPSCNSEDPTGNHHYNMQYLPPCNNEANFRHYPPPFTPSKEQPIHKIHFKPYPPSLPPSDETSKDTVVMQLREETWPARRIESTADCLQKHQQNIKTRRVKKKASLTLKVHEARQLLLQSLRNLEELQQLQKTLKLNYNDVSPALWKEKCDSIKNLRDQIETSLAKLNEPSTLEALRRILLKRSKKRKREKKMRALHREITQESYTRRQQLHENINNWLKDMQDVVEKAKTEESLKHEADQVLSEVTRRKAEARKQLNMLKALQKLRRIRAQTLTNQGQRVNIDSSIRFARVVDHLLKLWEDQLKEYEIEEQGLRVMLEEAVEERNKTEVKQIKQTLLQWEGLLFGKRVPFNEFYQAAEQDEETFITIRKSWDQFLAPAGAVMSSSIPIGWVIPGNPSSAEWESLLSKN